MLISSATGVCESSVDVSIVDLTSPVQAQLDAKQDTISLEADKVVCVTSSGIVVTNVIKSRLSQRSREQLRVGMPRDFYWEVFVFQAV